MFSHVRDVSSVKLDARGASAPYVVVANDVPKYVVLSLTRGYTLLARVQLLLPRGSETRGDDVARVAADFTRYRRPRGTGGISASNFQRIRPAFSASRRMRKKHAL